MAHLRRRTTDGQRVLRPWCQCCLDPGTRWRTLLAVVRAKTCSTPDSAARRAREANRCCALLRNKLPASSILARYMRGRPGTFFDFSPVFGFETGALSLVSAACDGRTGSNRCSHRWSDLLTSLASTYMNRLLIRVSWRS
jgi:hypothetical protein